MAARYPLSTASKPNVALSVSSSAIASPGLILSPIFFTHDAMLPCVIVGDSAGMSSTVCSGSAVDMRRTSNLESARDTPQETIGDEQLTKKDWEAATAGLERSATRVRRGRALARREEARNRCRAFIVARGHFNSLTGRKWSFVLLLCSNVGERCDCTIAAQVSTYYPPTCPKGAAAASSSSGSSTDSV